MAAPPPQWIGLGPTGSSELNLSTQLASVCILPCVEGVWLGLWLQTCSPGFPVTLFLKTCIHFQVAIFQEENEPPYGKEADTGLLSLQWLAGMGPVCEDASTCLLRHGGCGPHLEAQLLDQRRILLQQGDGLLSLKPRCLREGEAIYDRSHQGGGSWLFG